MTRHTESKTFAIPEKWVAYSLVAATQTQWRGRRYPAIQFEALMQNKFLAAAIWIGLALWSSSDNTGVIFLISYSCLLIGYKFGKANAD
ncbi:hypothetical protein [Bradyrhizobium ottawaense]|uniref:Uncharacterized protein n=1 Tax=Bradyrhizobium ottawaense TaxID=931866 RepID=A0ABY0QHA7_9BRAD|nr:hypothetical protein [Bradyrhizobium ottawaense]SDK43299.1 hypothetical protein SAMN05444163_8099 [Bradyrhizobium ottawaense]